MDNFRFIPTKLGAVSKKIVRCTGEYAVWEAKRLRISTTGSRNEHNKVVAGSSAKKRTIKQRSTKGSQGRRKAKPDH